MVAHPQAPCGRCFRLCLECKQPARKPYFRRSCSVRADEDEAEEGEGDASKSGGTKRRRRRGLEGVEVDATPLLELIIARNDPRGERSECRLGVAACDRRLRVDQGEDLAED